MCVGERTGCRDWLVACYAIAIVAGVLPLYDVEGGEGVGVVGDACSRANESAMPRSVPLAAPVTPAFFPVSRSATVRTGMCVPPTGLR